MASPSKKEILNLPDWPAAMNCEMAALYLGGLTPYNVEVKCREGVIVGYRESYDRWIISRAELDAYITRRTEAAREKKDSSSSVAKNLGV